MNLPSQLGGGARSSTFLPFIGANETLIINPSQGVSKSYQWSPLARLTFGAQCSLDVKCGAFTKHIIHTIISLLLIK